MLDGRLGSWPPQPPATTSDKKVTYLLLSGKNTPPHPRRIQGEAMGSGRKGVEKSGKRKGERGGMKKKHFRNRTGGLNYAINFPVNFTLD